jgi:hypothetical protein
MFNVAGVLLVLERTGSVVLAGITVAAATLPAAVSGPFPVITSAGLKSTTLVPATVPAARAAEPGWILAPSRSSLSSEMHPSCCTTSGNVIT